MSIDVGTGSGRSRSPCAREAHLQVTASDISEQAVAVARKNAADNAADVTFLTGDMLEPFIEAGIRCDILVSNPPYIPVHEQMEHSVVDFEPHVALFGGEDGLKFYREIFANAHRVIKEKAILAFEMGYDQGERAGAGKGAFPGCTRGDHQRSQRKESHAVCLSQPVKNDVFT
ncbi:MAG: N5-glutamine methyltransferase family protein [Merdibacter sp.]